MALHCLWLTWPFYCRATRTQHDSVIYIDNDFEVFFDADRSTRYYKVSLLLRLKGT